MRGPGIAALVLAALLSGPGCGTSTASGGSEGASGAREHAERSERLASLMRRLERLANERLPRPIDPLEEQEARAALVRGAALELASSAREIPQAAEGFAPADRRDMVALAAELEQASLELARSEPGAPLELLSQRSRHIELTCARCHGRFGVEPLDPRP